jgi:plasmid maintenance system killer protein
MWYSEGKMKAASVFVREDGTAGKIRRINDQWRICFVWRRNDEYTVEITDYH